MSCSGSSSGNLSAHTIDSAVKNLLANAGDMEVWVRSLGREDPLKKEMSTHSSILAWDSILASGATLHGVAKSWIRLSN